MSQQTLIDRLYKNKKGEITLFQVPNPPLIGWFIFKILSYLPVPDHFKTGLGFISTGFIIVWAYLELTEGTTYLRQVLGAVVLIALIVPKFLS